MEKPLGCSEDDNPGAKLPVAGQQRNEEMDGRKGGGGLQVSEGSLGCVPSALIAKQGVTSPPLLSVLIKTSDSRSSQPANSPARN